MLDSLVRRRATTTRTIATILAAFLTGSGFLFAAAGPAAAATPVGVADTISVKEDTAPNPVSGNVLANDLDPVGDGLFVTNGGTFTLNFGVLQIHADGSYTYTLDNSSPVVNALNNGQHLTDTFTYSIADGFTGTSTGTLTIRIDGTTENRSPAAVNDTPSINEDTAPNTISGNVLANDSDPDGNTLSVANSGTITLTYGVLQIHADGNYTYTLDNSNPVVNALNNGQHLTDTFTYTASDGHGGTATSTLTITINGTTDGNRPPVAANDAATVAKGGVGVVTGNVLTNDTDSDGDSLTAVGDDTSLTYGSIVTNADGSFTYTLDQSDSTVAALNDGQILADAVPYTISDGHGGTATSTLTITITGATTVYTVTFDSAGGSAIAPVSVSSGSTVAEPAEPTRAGHTFNGWYAVAGATGAPYDFSSPVSGNLVLYAGWQVTTVADEPETDGTSDGDQEAETPTAEDESTLPDTGGAPLQLGILTGALLIGGVATVTASRRRTSPRT